jgi:hypothetical protein
MKSSLNIGSGGGFKNIDHPGNRIRIQNKFKSGYGTNVFYIPQHYFYILAKVIDEVDALLVLYDPGVITGELTLKEGVPDTSSLEFRY